MQELLDDTSVESDFVLESDNDDEGIVDPEPERERSVEKDGE